MTENNTSLEVMSDEAVRSKIPETRGLAEEYNYPGKFRAYEHINQTYVLIVPEVPLSGPEQIKEYLEKWGLPVDKMNPLTINNCNGILVERKRLEKLCRANIFKQ